MPKRQRIVVNILAKPDTSSSTLFGLYDVLTSVGVGWETHVAGVPAAPQFDVRIVAATRKRLRCAGGILRASYGSDNYDRLVEIKTKYDPTNMFRLNQNIDPKN